MRSLISKKVLERINKLLVEGEKVRKIEVYTNKGTITIFDPETEEEYRRLLLDKFVEEMKRK